MGDARPDMLREVGDLRRCHERLRPLSDEVLGALLARARELDLEMTATHLDVMPFGRVIGTPDGGVVGLFEPAIALVGMRRLADRFGMRFGPHQICRDPFVATARVQVPEGGGFRSIDVSARFEDWYTRDLSAPLEPLPSPLPGVWSSSPEQALVRVAQALALRQALAERGITGTVYDLTAAEEHRQKRAFFDWHDLLVAHLSEAEQAASRVEP